MMSEREFDQLLKKYLEGKTSEDENQIIDKWFEQLSTSKYDLAEEDLGNVKREIFSRIQEQAKPAHTDVPKASSHSIGLWKYAATVTVLLLAGYWIYSTVVDDTEKNWVTQQTATGEVLELSLQDGSKVFLNALSSISYPKHFGKSSREVKVTGEVYFEVAKDAKRPFKVYAEKLNTSVLGTSFNVNAYKNELPRVSVLEGKVLVESISKGEKVTLLAHQEAQLDGNNALSKHAVDMDRVLAWRRGIFYLNNISLEEVGRIIERNYDVRIIFEDQATAMQTVSGKFKKDSLSNLLNQIQFIKDIHWEKTSNGTIKIASNKK
ncbi:FecR domain-containing protein [Echinicola marina]|uniref:FecR family protein n=1 Tax=Echinicola marina TaxID=2859768 RepID=UPI001CF69644|nr:FecR domain-containing protein [Echinicola marina]UCS92110.1 FecR domain-containing protein [Echinicola marina]